MLGDILGFGSSLIGGLLNANEAKKNRKLQKLAMTDSIQLRVKDAEKAGINPHFAIGAPTMSPAPITSGVGDMISQAGQNLGRAADAQLNKSEKLAHVDQVAQRLTLQRMGLENEKLASEIRLMRQPGAPPAMPGARTVIPGQGDAPLDPDANAMRVVLPRADDSKKDTWVAGAATSSQTIADLYGDLAQEGYGIARLGIDAYRNLVKPYADPAWAGAQTWLRRADASLPSLPRRKRGVGRYGGR